VDWDAVSLADGHLVLHPKICYNDKIKIKTNHGMATLFLKGLQKTRFLLVAALVLTLLSSPFLTNAGSKGNSDITISSITDTLAGFSQEIHLKGTGYETMELALKKPDGTVLLLEETADASGAATLMISEYHLRRAGIYQVAAREALSGETYGTAVDFEVFPSTVSDTKTSVAWNKQSASLGESLEMTVSLKDDYGNAIDGHVLKVIPKQAGVTAYSPNFVSDERGEMKFFVSSTAQGIYEFTLFDSSINKTIFVDEKVAFSGSEISDYTAVGGHEDSVFLAAESGEVDAFLIEGLGASTTVGDAETVTVSAIDGNGDTVQDYTGTIRFSSTDDSATLPGDYTFLAEDQGAHSFSLAVKFVTPGDQALSVTDLDEFSLRGETQTTVVTTEASGTDYEGDFESTDFEREGSFTLISPAAGSYSSDSIEVQGEAEYGLTAVVYLSGEEMVRSPVEFDNSFTVTVEDIEDGTYDLFVDIVELGEGEEGEEEILEVIETSDSEKITIDTTAPKIVSISTDPEEDLKPGDTVKVTVLSEKNLEEASIILEEEIFELKESSTAGKYEADLVLPSTEGEFSVDLILMDVLGNEVEYRDELTLSTLSTSGTPSGQSGIAAVTGLSVTGAIETALLSWEAAESGNPIAFYRVYYGPDSNSLYAISETYDASTNWSILNLAGGEEYYFAVSAVDSEGLEGPRSEVVKAIPSLSKVVDDKDLVDDTNTQPLLTGQEGNIKENPETGPVQSGLILISLLGASIAVVIRKRAVQKAF
jgi:hypothetical protein